MISSCIGVVQHTVGKLLTRATTLFQTSLQSKVYTQSYGPQSCGNPNFGNFGNPRTKCHLDVAPMERHRVYYKGEGGGFPQVYAMVRLVNLRLPVAYPTIKSVPTMH
jgi:hypothetical protein